MQCDELISLLLCSLLLSACSLSAHELTGPLYCFFLSHFSPAVQGLHKANTRSDSGTYTDCISKIHLMMYYWLQICIHLCLISVWSSALRYPGNSDELLKLLGLFHHLVWCCVVFLHFESLSGRRALLYMSSLTRTSKLVECFLGFTEWICI